MNIIAIILIVLAVLVLVIFLFVQNRKDRKKLEQQLNSRYPKKKDKEHEKGEFL